MTNEVKIATIADRAMILKLKMGRMTRYRQSKAGTRILDNATGKTGTARAQITLFEKVQMVEKVYTAFQAVYDNWFHQTVPWQDEEGARIISNDHAMEFFATHRQLVSEAETSVRALVAPNPSDPSERVWDVLVRQDMARLGSLADIKHYPDDPLPLFYVSLTPRPVPNISDFRCALPQDEIDKINSAVQEAEVQAKTYTVGVMMEPITRAISRLTEYKGDKGQRFHGSVITNISDALTQAKRLNIMGDPALTALIRESEDMLRPYLFAPLAVKESSVVRDSAQKKLDEVMAKMAVFVGGA